jgi:iron complex outermembrane recepter protein
MSRYKLPRLSLLALAIAQLGAIPATLPAALAAEPTGAAIQRSYNIPAGPLEAVLNRFGREAGILLSFPTSLTASLQSPGLQGSYTASTGLAHLLQGTGLAAEARGDGSYTLYKVPAAVTAEATLQAVTVTAASEKTEGLAEAYAGGQVARGARVGLLGNRDMMETPFSISAYTSELIENQQATSIADVVANDASVRNVYGRGNYRDQFMIRGFPAYNFDVAFNGLAGMMPYDLTLLDLVERVEIHKGPNAMLNGNVVSAIGGTINLVPKRAGDTPLTRFTASLSGRDLAGGHLDVGRRYGEHKEWGIRFNGSYRQGETAIEDNRQELGVLGIGADYRGERVRLSADLGWQYSRVDAPQDTVNLNPGVAVPKAPDAARNLAQSWQYSKNVDRFIALRGEFDVTDRISLFAAFGSAANDQEYLFGGHNVNDNQGNSTVWSYFFPTFSRTSTGQVGINSRFETGPVKHELTLAAAKLFSESGWGFTSFRSLDSNIYRRVKWPSPSMAGVANDPPKDSENELDSLALADTLSMLDGRLQLLLGLRQQRVRSTSFNPDGSVSGTPYDEKALTPAMGVIVQAAKGITLYANSIEALTSGPTASAPAINAGEVFAPYKSKQQEIGVKFDWQHLAATISVFQIAKPSGRIDPVSMVYSLNGEQRNRGLEVSLFGEPARGVRLLAGVMYLDPKLTKTEGGLNDGNDAIAAPRWSANLGGEWDVPGWNGLSLNGRVLYTSSQFLDAENTLEIPGWTRFDLGARYQTRFGKTPVTLRASVENLFDRNYWASANAGQLLLGAPRTFLLSASFDY